MSPFTALKATSIGTKMYRRFINSSSLLISYCKLALFVNVFYTMLGNSMTIADNIIGPLSALRSISWAKFVMKALCSRQIAMILEKRFYSGTADIHVGC